MDIAITSICQMLMMGAAVLLTAMALAPYIEAFGLSMTGGG